MIQTRLIENDLAKVKAIVSIFETGNPVGDYAACAVLNDGAGISYGTHQFTHSSGSLRSVVERYLASGGAIGRAVMENRTVILRKTTRAAIKALASDTKFVKALKAAAVTREMRMAQDAVAYEQYMKPAADECEQRGFVLPLSLAVVYDSAVHGSWERLSNHVDEPDEKTWITEYVRLRHKWLLSVPRLRPTAYRTAFFLTQISLGRWQLELPLIVRGVRLSASDLSIPETRSSQIPADILPNDPQGSRRTGRDREAAAPATLPRADLGRVLDVIEGEVNTAAQKVDQAERIVDTTVTRSDKAKSLWTAVSGTIWQMAWAAGGIASGIPREVWLVVAVIAGALMLLYLYRQIVLGRIREVRETPH